MINIIFLNATDPMTCFINDAGVNSIPCTLKVFPFHINTLKIGMSIIYFKSSHRPPVKSAYLKIIFLISQSKHML